MSGMPTVVIAETCPYCSHARSPRDIMRFPGFTMCLGCYEQHRKALMALATGRYTGCCSECGKNWQEIMELQGDVDTAVRMVLHSENGIYRPMCLQCSDAYVPKRRDLYGGTQYWKGI